MFNLLDHLLTCSFWWVDKSDCLHKKSIPDEFVLLCFAVLKNYGLHLLAQFLLKTGWSVVESVRAELGWQNVGQFWPFTSPGPWTKSVRVVLGLFAASLHYAACAINHIPYSFYKLSLCVCSEDEKLAHSTLMMIPPISTEYVPKLWLFQFSVVWFEWGPLYGTVITLALSSLSEPERFLFCFEKCM